ncbi:MAG: succinylglutamate desuccinylase/aspartoacylase family protein [Alphaproteobacteria bacterium]|nr:succinylglutamate desuccinylase/aspartoacylase family protein [Alphaproteobacteria bacterium]
MNVVWTRTPGPAARSTFAWQIPGTITLEGGVGNRLTAGVGQALAEGLLNVLNVLAVLPDDCLTFHWAAVTRPHVVSDPQVHRVRANAGGLFLPARAIWDAVEAGEVLGEIVAPTSGEVLARIEAPVSGRLLAVREQPVVLPGSMVARVVELSDD